MKYKSYIKSDNVAITHDAVIDVVKMLVSDQKRAEMIVIDLELISINDEHKVSTIREVLQTYYKSKFVYKLIRKMIYFQKSIDRYYDEVGHYDGEGIVRITYLYPDKRFIRGMYIEYVNADDEMSIESEQDFIKRFRFLDETELEILNK